MHNYHEKSQPELNLICVSIWFFKAVSLFLIRRKLVLFLPLQHKWSHIISGLLIELVVCTIAIWELKLSLYVHSLEYCSGIHFNFLSILLSMTLFLWSLYSMNLIVTLCYNHHNFKMIQCCIIQILNIALLT